MGNKYIIEIEESYSRDGWSDESTPNVLYRVKNFNSLVFDGHGLNKLEKYDPEKEYNRGYKQGCADTEKENMLLIDVEACGYKKGYEKGLKDAYGYENGYEQGLNDAWKAAKIIVNSPMTDHLKEIFGTTYADDVIPTITAKDAIYKIGIYEEKQKSDSEIRVGDEVKVNDVKGIVTRTRTEDGDLWIDVMFSDGSGFLYNTTTDTVTKTNRHFPEVVELLKKIPEEEE